MATWPADGPNPEFYHFQFSTLTSGRIRADLRTGCLLGADRTLRGRAVVDLDLYIYDLLGLSPRERYDRLAVAVHRSLIVPL